MRKRWKILIGILALLVVIACIAALSFPDTSFSSHKLPLSEKWSTSLHGNIQQISIIDNKVIISRTRSEVYALDIRSGNILWQKRIARHLVPDEPVKTKENLLFLTDAEYVMTLDQSNGKILWQQPLLHPASAEVVDVSPEFVAVSDMPYLSLYHTTDGELLWSQWVCRERAQAYFLDSTIVVPCFGLKAMDIDSGEIVWETKLENGVDRIWKSAFADGVIYFSQDLENITAYDVKNRKQLWKTPLENGRSQALKVVGDYLFVTQYDQLCVLHRDNGSIVWCTGGMIKAQNPVIFGDIVYLFNGLQSGITAFNIDDGSQIGRLDFPAYNFITIDYDWQLMVSSDEFLIFANGEKIYAYGK